MLHRKNNSRETKIVKDLDEALAYARAAKRNLSQSSFKVVSMIENNRQLQERVRQHLNRKRKSTQ
jgi:hypothetical protein